MACDKDHFEKFCGPQFNEIKQTLAEFKTAICGDTERPGFAERLRSLERWQKAIMAALTAVVLALLPLLAGWVLTWFQARP